MGKSIKPNASLATTDDVIVTNHIKVSMSNVCHAHLKLAVQGRVVSFSGTLFSLECWLCICFLSFTFIFLSEAHILYWLFWIIIWILNKRTTSLPNLVFPFLTMTTMTMMTNDDHIGSFWHSQMSYAKMSLYDHHLSSSSLVLLASVSVDSVPVTFQNGCHIMILLPPSGGNW